MVQETREKRNHIRVIVCRPGERAEVMEIGETLEAMQEVVGGYIEEYMPFTGEDPREDDIAIICNSEGKLNGMTPSRAIEDEDGHVKDIIAGPFFICFAPLDSDTFESFPPDLEEKYLRKFELPERFYLTDEGIRVDRYEPCARGRDTPYLR